MKSKYLLFVFIFCLLFTIVQAVPPGKSFYIQKPEDSSAVYFTPDIFSIKADGSTDVSDALQKAIDMVKSKYNFGIVFIPEGKYLISKTIYVPQAVRLIGYGKIRPQIILQKNAPGFQEIPSGDKGNAKYMFWFTSTVPKDGERVNDAGAGTFYSGFSNIDLKIESGNPLAVALRTHYAQHSFVSHVDIQIGAGKAGMFEVGNEMEDIRFFGGDYGIYTTKPSPGWQFMMTDTYFEGQRKAAIKTQEAGLTIVRMTVKNVPTVINIDSNYNDKIFIEDGSFEQVSGPAFIISNEGSAGTQINIRNVNCRQVPVWSLLRNSKEQIVAPGIIYKVTNFTYGWQMDDLGQEPVCKVVKEMNVENYFASAFTGKLPSLPAMDSWVNLKTLGAIGDGITDDTKAIQDAIDRYPAIYVPQGWYKVSSTLHLKNNTALIGLHPMATQFFIDDNTEAFGGFGGPQPIVETPKDGTNILTGIGLNTGAYNNRAVACKWMAGPESYMNDVKFIGGHGSMARPQPQPANTATPTQRNRQNNNFGSRVLPGMDVAWDTQYWSLWITDGGGGTFKNIWTANTFASSGIYVSNTSTPSCIYAMSIEHHVRNEVRFKNVSNWKIYAMQLEEESREGSLAQPVELDNCENLVFANLYMFRVIRVNTPFAYSIRTWNCRNLELLNVHNFAQTKYTTTVPLYDVNADTEVRPWEFARLHISGSNVNKQIAAAAKNEVYQLAKGFEFADGICKDSKGNIYFSETRQKKIYKWSAATRSLSLVADFPWEPLSLGCDRDDRLLVVFKYVPRPGYLKEGKPETFPLPQDASGTSFSGWGNSGFGVWVYSINLENPEASIQLLKKVPMPYTNIYKALYPSNRWRDYHDFSSVVVNKPAEAFIALDGVTIIPDVYDLARSNTLIEAFPGKKVYATDEYDKRTVQLQVSKNGYLENLQSFTERGEFNNTTDAKGNVYIADGQIYVYDASGKQTGIIKVPERPATICIGGADGKSLFITTRSSLYVVSIP
ncbi:MAG: gluconolaconase [Ferruginibacter sp.]|nr:gluconolaconase [Ferruginibacter sp.]